MRLLICGDRNWTRRDIILREVQNLMLTHTIDVVIEGEARGADKLGRSVAEELGIPVLKFPADWEQYGKAAGPIRNGRMILEGQPDRVLAFHNDIANSKGTAHMVSIATKAEILVKIVTENEGDLP